MRDTIYRGELSSIVYSAIKHVMIPDMLVSAMFLPSICMRYLYNESVLYKY